MLRFEEFTPDNWREDLRVAPEQERFVAPRVAIQARAWAYRKDHACAYLVKNDDASIGVVLWYDLPEENMYVLSEFFIDARYQRQGFGEAAMTMALDYLADEGRYPSVILCYVAGNEGARRLYGKLGFTPCDFDEGAADEEPCMSLLLDDWRKRRREASHGDGDEV